MRIVILAAAVLSAAGCSSTSVTNTASINYVSISPDLANVAATVTEIQGSPPEGARALGAVDIQACQRLTSDPVPTREYALALLKQEAASKGADAISNVRVSGVSTVSIAGNCWANVTATGSAYATR